MLTWAAYEELGGLAGAIARRAQETYDALPPESRHSAAKQIFGELVTLDAANEGPATRRRAKLAELREVHPGVRWSCKPSASRCKAVARLRTLVRREPAFNNVP